MKATELRTELRIGNWVNEEIIGDCKVSQILNETIWTEANNVKTDDSFNKIEYHLRYFSPIPLTEEWLVKFGWIWNKECNSYEKYPDGDARMHLTKIDVNNSYMMFNYVLKATIAKRIWYVHQLQNLYFALTSKELTIKNLKNEQKDTTD